MLVDSARRDKATREVTAVTEHVDIVQYDWARTQQVRVGILSINGSVTWKQLKDGPWWTVVEKAWDSCIREFGPERAIHRLHEVIDSSTIAVSQVHDDDNCVFVKDDVVAMQAVPVEIFNS